MEITEKHGKQLGILDEFGMLGFFEPKNNLEIYIYIDTKTMTEE